MMQQGTTAVVTADLTLKNASSVRPRPPSPPPTPSPLSPVLNIYVCDMILYDMYARTRTCVRADALASTSADVLALAGAMSLAVCIMFWCGCTAVREVRGQGGYRIITWGEREGVAIFFIAFAVVDTLSERHTIQVLTLEQSRCCCARASLYDFCCLRCRFR